MTFNIIKFAAVTVLGWVLVRSFGSEREQAEEGTETSRPDEDSVVEADFREVQSTESASGGPAEPDPEPAVAPQKLAKIRGIGPAIEALLNARGISTWAQLAATEVTDLQTILDDAGPRYRVHDPSTWPAQAAELAQAN